MVEFINVKSRALLKCSTVLTVEHYQVFTSDLNEHYR